MSRHESDREDLMREATALARRIELRVPGEAEPITAGWRPNGWLSIYFGQDPAWHFDEVGRLRRAYVDGFLYRTQGNTLARLDRQRTERETTLLRRDLTPEELQTFLQSMRTRLAAFSETLVDGTVETLRTVDEMGAILPDLATSLKTILSQPQPLAPPIAARR